MTSLSWLNSDPVDNAWFDRVTDYMSQNPNDQAFYEQAVDRGVSSAFPSSSGVPFRDSYGNQVTLRDTWTPDDDYDFSGYDTDTGTEPAGQAGQRTPAYMNAPSDSDGGGSGGSSSSINIPRYDKKKRDQFISGLENTKPAEYGELPTLEYGTFEAPKIDKNRIRFLTQENMVPAQSLRSEVNRMRLAAQAGGSPDDMRKILEGYGTSLASVYGGATKAAQGEYGYEHGVAMNEALTNFQTRVDEAGKNWGVAVQRVRDLFSADRTREDNAKNILTQWYNI